MDPPADRAANQGDHVLWYLGPSALFLGVAAFVIIVLMAVFGAGSVLVFLRRGGRFLGPRARPASRVDEKHDVEVRKLSR